jgi:hypothetical protein
LYLSEIHAELHSPEYRRQLRDVSFRSIINLQLGHKIHELFSKQIEYLLVVIPNEMGLLLLGQEIGDAIEAGPQGSIEVVGLFLMQLLWKE